MLLHVITKSYMVMIIYNVFTKITLIKHPIIPNWFTFQSAPNIEDAWKKGVPIGTGPTRPTPQLMASRFKDYMDGMLVQRSAVEDLRDKNLSYKKKFKDV